MIEAVIFDFDGVIADTMKDNYLAWELAFESQGVHIGPKEYFLLEGMGRYDIARFFIKKYKLDPAILETVVSQKEMNYEQHNSFKIYPEIPPLLEFLQSNSIKTAIVTGASRNRMKQTLPANIAAQLTAVVTADDVTYSKPHPSPYLQAIEMLEIPAAQCYVIENAPMGITSAKAAGCHCLAVATTLNINYLQEADSIFLNHKGIYEYLTLTIDKY